MAKSIVHCFPSLYNTELPNGYVSICGLDMSSVINKGSTCSFTGGQWSCLRLEAILVTKSLQNKRLSARSVLISNIMFIIPSTDLHCVVLVSQHENRHDFLFSTFSIGLYIQNTALWHSDCSC